MLHEDQEGPISNNWVVIMSRFIAGPLYKSRWLYIVIFMKDSVLNNFDSFHFYPDFDETGFTI